MDKECDFSKGKRGAVISTKGKTRITIMLDDDVLEFFRTSAEAKGSGYQTLINATLRDTMLPIAKRKGDHQPLTVATLRKVLREEFDLS